MDLQQVNIPGSMATRSKVKRTGSDEDNHSMPRPNTPATVDPPATTVSSNWSKPDSVNKPVNTYTASTS